MVITEIFIILVTYDFRFLLREVKFHNSHGHFAKIRESCSKYAGVLKNPLTDCKNLINARFLWILVTSFLL